MARELRGVVKGGVIVIEGEERLPEGTKVRIVVEEGAEREPKWESAERLIGKARDREGRRDVSERVDEYLARARFELHHTRPKGE